MSRSRLVEYVSRCGSCPIVLLSRLTVSANALLEVADLSEGGVLAACAKEVAQRLDLNTAVTALVKEGECLLVVCCVGLIHCLSLDLYATLGCRSAGLQEGDVVKKSGMAVVVVCCSKDGSYRPTQNRAIGDFWLAAS